MLPSGDRSSADSFGNSSMLEKAIELLDSLADHDTPLGVSQLARQTGLPKTTTHRLLTQLRTHRMVDAESGGYVLGSRIQDLAATHIARSPLALRHAAVPYMLDLYALDPRSVIGLGVLDGRRVRYLSTIYGHLGAEVSARFADHAPLHCTAVGKALLAHAPGETVDALFRYGPLPAITPYTRTTRPELAAELAEIRRDGIAINRQEYHLGVDCVAAPVLDPQGQPLAAVSVGARALEFEIVTPALRRSAAAIGLIMGSMGRTSR